MLRNYGKLTWRGCKTKTFWLPPQEMLDPKSRQFASAWSLIYLSGRGNRSLIVWSFGSSRCDPFGGLKRALFKGWVIKGHLEDAGSYCSLLFLVGVAVAGCTIIVCLSRWFVTPDVSQFFSKQISQGAPRMNIPFCWRSEICKRRFTNQLFFQDGDTFSQSFFLAIFHVGIYTSHPQKQDVNILHSHDTDSR